MEVGAASKKIMQCLSGCKIGLKLLRFDKKGLKGCFHPSSVFPTLLVQDVSLVLFCQTLSEHVHHQLSWPTSPFLYAKSEENSLWSANLKERNPFISLCSRSKSLDTAPANYQKPPWLQGAMPTAYIVFTAHLFAHNVCNR